MCILEEIIDSRFFRSIFRAKWIPQTKFRMYYSPSLLDIHQFDLVWSTYVVDQK